MRLLRKTIGLLLLGFTCMSVSAQVRDFDDFLSIRSLTRQFSSDLFSDELHAATSVVTDGAGVQFGESTGTYVFAGLGNLNEAIATGGVNGTLNAPVLAGIYDGTGTPWSLFGGLHVVGRNQSFLVNETTQQKTLTDGGDQTDYNWVDFRRTTDIRRPQNVRLQSQWITSTPAANFGLYLDLEFSGGESRTIEESFYFDDADAADPPDVTLSRVQTTERQPNGRSVFVGAGLPVFISTDTGGHHLVAQFALSRDPLNVSSERNGWETIALADGAGPESVNLIDNRTEDLEWTTEARAQYSVFLPPVFSDGENDSLRIGAAPYGARTSRTSRIRNRTDLRTFDGTSVSDGNTIISEQTTVYEPAWTLGLELAAAHSLYQSLAGGFEFAVRPEVSLDTSTTPDGGVRPLRIETDDQQRNADGDNITRVETVTVTDYAARGRETEVSTTASVPTALKGRPEGWFAGFILSGKPAVSHTVTFTTAYPEDRDSRRVETTTTNGINSPGTTVVSTEYAESERSLATAHAWSFSAEYALGLFVPLSEQARLDVSLTGGTAVDFNNLTIQATVEL